jgi:pyruvate/2-oxoglutarate dehydrogenase complex dihydrolipoamide dehydrogenase (E3) component
MPEIEQFDVVILGSGQGGKLLAWHLSRTGKKVAVVERRWVGGSCPAVACLPSKNEIWSAKVAHVVRNSAPFGTDAKGIKADMRRVRDRKQAMIEREISAHLDAYRSSGAELVMGSGKFVGPRTIEVSLNDGGTRTLSGAQVVVNVGTHAAIPRIPGLLEAHPLTHVETLELDYVPSHLVVLGGGYVGIEFAQMFRRLGSRVTIVEPGRQLMGREDEDVSKEIREALAHEGIEVLTQAEAVSVAGLSGDAVAMTLCTVDGEKSCKAAICSLPWVASPTLTASASR